MYAVGLYLNLDYDISLRTFCTICPVNILNGFNMQRYGFVVLLAALTWTMPARSEEASSVEVLLRAAADSSNAEAQHQALIQFFERKPEARIVRAMALLVIQDSSDLNVSHQAEFVIYSQVQKEPLLPAPTELLVGLKSKPEIRRRTLSTLKMFRCFNAADLPELLEEVRLHDDACVFLASSFSDLPRLKKLAAESTGEVRSMALHYLWGATHDLDLCLSLYLDSVYERLPDEVRDHGDEAERKIKVLEGILQALDKKAAQRDLIAQRHKSLSEDPIRLRKVYYDLSILSRARTSYELTFEFPIACGKILAAIVIDESAVVWRRTHAAGVLASIAKTDNHDRELLVNLGVTKQLAACQAAVTDPQLRVALQECITTLNTPHGSAKASSVAAQLDEKDDTKIPDFFAPE